MFPIALHFYLVSFGKTSEGNPWLRHSSHPWHLARALAATALASPTYLPTYLDFSPCFSTCLSGSPSFLPIYLPCVLTHNFHLPGWLSFLLSYLPCLLTHLFYLPGCLSFLPIYLVFLPTFSTYLATSPSYLSFTLTYLPTSLLFLPTVWPNQKFKAVKEVGLTFTTGNFNYAKGSHRQTDTTFCLKTSFRVLNDRGTSLRTSFQDPNDGFSLWGPRFRSPTTGFLSGNLVSGPSRGLDRVLRISIQVLYLSFFSFSFNLTSIPGPERSIRRQLHSWLEQNTPIV
jgi:hypothetical protein